MTDKNTNESKPKSRLHIPREHSQYPYDESDQKALIVTLHNHLLLIKACLHTEFVVDSYYLERGGRFIERGYDQRNFLVELTGEGQITSRKNEWEGEKNRGIINPSSRSVFIPIRSHGSEHHAIPKDALARIDNVQILADAFAHVYGLNSAAEIVTYARARNKKLN